MINTITQVATTTAHVVSSSPNTSEGIHIALAAEHIGSFFGIPITNTLVTSWAVIVLLFIFSIIVSTRITLVPGRLQTLVEEMIIFILNYMTKVLESEKLARTLFPFITTIFLFVFTANVIEFTPGIGSIGFFEHIGSNTSFIPIFRSVSTDLNVTLALAIISFVVTEIIGVATLGFLKYTGKFINFKSPIGFAVGIIELFSEVARLISFSFRLFGNILAGEILIAVVIFFIPYIVPVPMMLFEVFVGIIQAAIFALLTLFFIKIAITEPH